VKLSGLKEISHIQDAALLDMGDGIACLEFRSKGNSITPDLRLFLLDVIRSRPGGFQGLVLGNEGKNFSVGADLVKMRENISTGNFEAFRQKIRSFQEMTLAARYCGFPVVAAVSGMTLGGGLELALHADRRVADPACRLGLIECGVGLTPSGGGAKECAMRIAKADGAARIDVMMSEFRKLVERRISKSALNAAEMGFLMPDDVILREGEDRLERAKQVCLSMVPDYAAPSPGTAENLPGKEGYDAMMRLADEMLSDEKISPYDLEVAKRIAGILSGGSDAKAGCVRTEQQLLDAEFNAFDDLVHQEGTFRRISHFVETGELLRN